MLSEIKGSVVVAVGNEDLSWDKRCDPEHSEPLSADPFSDILIISSLPHKQATLAGASAQLPQKIMPRELALFDVQGFLPR